MKNQRSMNPFTLPSLTQKEILIALVNYSEQKGSTGLSANEMYSILNNMTLENGFREFDQGVAGMFFDQILKISKKKLLTLEQLSITIHETEKNYRQQYEECLQQEEILEDSLSLLHRMDEYLRPSSDHLREGDHFFLLEEVKLKVLPQYRGPFLQIRNVRQSFSSETTHKGKDGWYSWKLNLRLPIATFFEDIEIAAFDESGQSLGGVRLSIESLPFKDIAYTQLQLVDNDSWTDNNIQICGLLELGSAHSALELSNQKQTEQQKHLSATLRDMEILETKLREIQKPFKIQHNAIKQSNAIKLSRASQQEWVQKPENDSEEPLQKYIKRTDIFSLVNLLLSALISFERADFLNSSLALFFMMCIMCKKGESYLHAFIALVVFSLMCDIFWVAATIPMPEEEFFSNGYGGRGSWKGFVLTMTTLNVLIKFGTLVSSISLMKPSNLLYLKSHILQK